MSNPVLAVIAGGGCRQIEAATGMLQALEAAGIRIDRYNACSAGACVAALHASGLSGAGLEKLIRNTPVEQLFRPCIGHQLLALFGMRVDHLFDPAGMYGILRRSLTTEARRRVRVAVTRLPDYAPMMCDATAVTVMASAALPQVFEPVKIGPDHFVDGGVKNLVPTPRIGEIADYRHIYILLCNDDVTGAPPRGRLGRALSAAFATMDREVTQLYESGWHLLPNVTVIQPPPFPSSLLDWSDGYRLIAHAREYAAEIIRREKA